MGNYILIITGKKNKDEKSYFSCYVDSNNWYD